jgi:hypothetical protein
MAPRIAAGCQIMSSNKQQMTLITWYNVMQCYASRDATFTPGHGSSNHIQGDLIVFLQLPCQSPHNPRWPQQTRKRTAGTTCPCAADICCRHTLPAAAANSSSTLPWPAAD